MPVRGHKIEPHAIMAVKHRISHKSDAWKVQLHSNSWQVHPGEDHRATCYALLWDHEKHQRAEFKPKQNIDGKSSIVYQGAVAFFFVRLVFKHYQLPECSIGFIWSSMNVFRTMK